MSLRSWLRKSPQPAKLRIRTEDDDIREVELSEDVRNRWKSAEETVLAARATSVECLTAEGKVLRAQELVYDDDGQPGAGEPPEQRFADKIVSRTHKELAGLFDAYGKRLNEAYEKGAKAAQGGQEQLISTLDLMTVHLASAISNFHKVSVQAGELLLAVGGEDKEKADDALSGLLALVLKKHMSGGVEEVLRDRANGGAAKRKG